MQQSKCCRNFRSTCVTFHAQPSWWGQKSAGKHRRHTDNAAPARRTGSTALYFVYFFDIHEHGSQLSYPAPPNCATSLIHPTQRTGLESQPRQRVPTRKVVSYKQSCWCFLARWPGAECPRRSRPGFSLGWMAGILVHPRHQKP